MQPWRKQIEEITLQQTSFVVPFFWPWIRKKNEDPVENLICDRYQKVANILIRYPDIFQPGGDDPLQQSSQTGPIDFDRNEILAA